MSNKTAWPLHFICALFKNGFQRLGVEPKMSFSLKKKIVKTTLRASPMLSRMMYVFLFFASLPRLDDDSRSKGDSQPPFLPQNTCNKGNEL